MSGVDFCAFNISFGCSFPLRFLKAPHNYFKWRALFPLPSLNEVLQLTVVFIAALIAHAQKLVVLCKMQMMDPNDCTSLSSSGRCFIDVFIKLSEQQGWMHRPKYFLFIGEKYRP